MPIDFAKVDFSHQEIEAVNRVLSGTQLASGPENELFEKEFSAYVGSTYALCVNSGSSANLIALASLGLPRGSKVLTSACGFPATLSPIYHLGLEPVFADYDFGTHNIDVPGVVKLIPEVKAAIFAHTLGNPVTLAEILHEAFKYEVPIIEDCCEAVGSTVNDKHLGTFGDLGTYSFYPAHQMTALGGGGMIVTDNEDLYNRMKSLRDWGKTATWDSQKGGNATDYNSSIGYHTGYTYDTIGWNFKLPEANCAFGREQLKKLDSFREVRFKNWKYLHDGLRDIPEIKISPMPEGSSPFGFCMDVPSRNEFGLYLESRGIKHRPFFAGNILRQPAFKSSEASKFPMADTLMTHTLFIGCHTKLTKENLNYMVETIHEFFDRGYPKLQWHGHSEGVHTISIGSDSKAG